MERGLEASQIMINRLKEKGFGFDEKGVRDFMEKNGSFLPLVWEAIFGKKGFVDVLKMNVTELIFVFDVSLNFMKPFTFYPSEWFEGSIWHESNLDSSVETQFQYLRSSIPVMDIALVEIDKQTLPVTLSNHTSCNIPYLKTLCGSFDSHTASEDAAPRKARLRRARLHISGGVRYKKTHATQLSGMSPSPGPSPAIGPHSVKLDNDDPMFVYQLILTVDGGDADGVGVAERKGGFLIFAVIVFREGHLDLEPVRNRTGYNVIGTVSVVGNDSHLSLYNEMVWKDDDFVMADGIQDYVPKNSHDGIVTELQLSQMRSCFRFSTLILYLKCATETPAELACLDGMESQKDGMGTIAISGSESGSEEKLCTEREESDFNVEKTDGGEKKCQGGVKSFVLCGKHVAPTWPGKRHGVTCESNELLTLYTSRHPTFFCTHIGNILILLISCKNRPKWRGEGATRATVHDPRLQEPSINQTFDNEVDYHFGTNQKGKMDYHFGTEGAGRESS
ncbi:hypothetical protein LXL04_014874 [Taraxacum kok-saghyz]